MIRISLERPVAVTMAYLTVVALGVAAWFNIPVELLPDAELPRLTISTDFPGASPEVTEAFLTAPLEAVVQQVRDVEKITSVSSEGRSSIEVWFTRDADMDFARLELSERIASIEQDLPLGSRPPRVEEYVPREFEDQQRPFLSYTITGPYTLEYMREYVDDVIAPDLTQLDGVAGVIALGGRACVLELELNEARIQSLGLRPETVRQRVMDLEFVREAGAVETPSGIMRTLAIRQRPESADEVRALPVLVDNGRIVRVGDIARVYETWEEPTGHYRIDGFPAASFHVQKGVNTNAVRVADAVKARLAQLAPSLPTGTRLILGDDQSKDIREQLADLRTRALVSAVIVLAVLLLFLGSPAAAGIVFATVVFAVMITLNVIYFGGLTLNLLTLMGLAMGFGLVVDNAIVVLENTYRLRRTGMTGKEAAHRGAREVVLPILTATGTTVVVVMPFVYLQGELRVYYVPLAIVVAVSLIASLLVAFTFIPAVSRRLLAGVQAAPGVVAADGPARFEDTLPRIARLYAGLVRGTLRFPWVAITIALLMLGGSYFLFDRYVSRGVLWGWGGGNDTYIDIRIQQPRGGEIERTDELARFFEARLREMPEVDRFVTNVAPSHASIRVTFPEALAVTSVPVAIKEQLVQYSLLFGGTDVRVYGFGPSFYGGGGSPPNYSIRILGYNYEQVRTIAEDLAARLQRFSRIRDVDTNAAGQWFQRDRATELVLDIDRARLALHDLSAQDVVQQVRAAVAGQTQVGTVRVGGEEMRFAVKLEGYRDMDMQRLSGLLIPTPGGGAVRLDDVATLRERDVLARVVRENQQYTRNVSYEFRGPAKMGDMVREAVVGATALPPGYTIEDRQAWLWSTEEKQQIYGVMAVALVLIFMVCAALFESLRQPFCVLLSVPMSLIGVFLVFFYTGASFTREAYVGVIMMAGIVVNNAILLVDHMNQLRRRDGMSLRDAVLRGSLERVRPILMTSATTVFGLLPLVLLSGANERIWNALTYSLIGGLTSSTLLVLTITPAIYLILERRRDPAAQPAKKKGEHAVPTPSPS